MKNINLDSFNIKLDEELSRQISGIYCNKCKQKVYHSLTYCSCGGKFDLQLNLSKKEYLQLLEGNKSVLDNILYEVISNAYSKSDNLEDDISFEEYLELKKTKLKEITLERLK